MGSPTVGDSASTVDARTLERLAVAGAVNDSTPQKTRSAAMSVDLIMAIDARTVRLLRMRYFS